MKPDLTGSRFGRLTVLSEQSAPGRQRQWLCKCDCGNEKVVYGSNLKMERTTSCGCYNKELRTTHGAHGTVEYHVWEAMLNRCRNPHHNRYIHYGGRGIRVCDEWQSFAAFIRDMGQRPAGRLTIERLDTNGNYEPGNCQWMTYSAQNKNRRKTKANTSGITGVRITEWGKWTAHIGVDRKNIYLGIFDNMEDAQAARKAAEIQYGFTMYGHDNA